MRAINGRKILYAGCLMAMVGFFLSGCTATSDRSAMQRDQDKALADPMNYSVNMDNTDITGGDTGNFDAKAMKRDLDDFWNP